MKKMPFVKRGKKVKTQKRERKAIRHKQVKSRKKNIKAKQHKRKKS